MEDKQGKPSKANKPKNKKDFLILAAGAFLFLTSIAFWVIRDMDNYPAPEPSSEKSKNHTDLEMPIDVQDISVVMTSVKIDLSENIFYERGRPVDGIIARGAVTCNLPKNEACRIKNAGAYLWLGQEPLPLEFVLTIPEEIPGGRRSGFRLESSSISQKRERRLPFSVIEFQIMLAGERDYHVMWFDTEISFD